jgi:hypothetical protein
MEFDSKGCKTSIMVNGWRLYVPLTRFPCYEPDGTCKTAQVRPALYSQRIGFPVIACYFHERTEIGRIEVPAQGFEGKALYAAKRNSDPLKLTCRK